MRPLSEGDRNRLDELFVTLTQQQKTYIGFPNSQILDNQSLARFLDFTINNIGDPYHPNNGMNTCLFEQEVLEFFQELLHIRREDSWGYTTNGGTEGNLFGLYCGRESFPNGIAYYSRDAHYSIAKNVRLLNLPSKVIRSQWNGEMDYDHFKETVKGHRSLPVIVNANIGTTMTGAIDNVERILDILTELHFTDYYIHCDAALFGSMLPFIPGAPLADFRLPIGSISLSGHKFLGSPIPCGLVIACQNHVKILQGNAEYVGSIDTTISGSRDGFSVLILWQEIKRHGKEGLAELVKASLEMTEYTLQALKKINWPAWKNPCSNIVVIKKPELSLIKKWQLATQGDWSHLVLMPGVPAERIDQFVEDLKTIQSPLALSTEQPDTRQLESRSRREYDSIPPTLI
jgi:histidine decarboxylase